MKNDEKNITYTTHSSFLRRVQDGNESAWNEFYDKYSGMIFHIGQQRYLSTEECEDLKIEVMTIFWSKMEEFVYDSSKGKFRSYLSQIADFCAQRRFSLLRRHKNLLNSLKNEYPEEVDSQYMDEWRQFLLQQAMEELKRSVDMVTYQVFHMSFIQQRPIADICTITRKTANNVYIIRYRCFNKLRKLLKEYRQFSEMEFLRHSQRKKEEY